MPPFLTPIAVDAVAYARSLGCDDVEFSPEDAGRSEPAFLHRILTAVVEAGATTLNGDDNSPGDVIERLAEIFNKL